MKKKIIYSLLALYFIFCIVILVRDQPKGISGSEILHTITFGVLGKNDGETLFITEFGSEGKKHWEIHQLWKKNCVEKKISTKCNDYEKYLIEKKVLVRNNKN